MLRLLSLLLIAFSVSGAEFHNQVLFLLDHQENKFLFRGKLPEADGEFCYDELIGGIRSNLEAQGKTLRPHFQLFYVSLMNGYESKKNRVEAAWFLNHRTQGAVWRFPLFGSFLNPLAIPQSIQNAFLRYDTDGLNQLMRTIHMLMASEHPNESDLVVYIHCNAGKDRTGEASACYLMQFKGMPYQKAVALNERIARRKLRTLSMNAIRWYALELRDRQGVNTVGVIE